MTIEFTIKWKEKCHLWTTGIPKGFTLSCKDAETVILLESICLSIKTEKKYYVNILSRLVNNNNHQ